MWFFGSIFVLTILSWTAHGMEVPKSFGCKNSLISDEWRAAVLNFHNEHRRKVARGLQETNSGTAKMPHAKNMFELAWDCDLEHNAFLYLSNSTAYPLYNTQATTEIATITTKKSCNITEKTFEILEMWWSECNKTDLSKSQNKFNESIIPNFGRMVFGPTTLFACTYNISSSSTASFVCIYNRRVKDGKALYSRTNKDDMICGNCTDSCVKYLCQSEDYTTAENVNPPSICAGGDNMTYDMEMTALYMHNYLRRNLATGWAPDSDGYAPIAKKMPELEYDCDLANKTYVLLSGCGEPPYEATANHSLNYYKTVYSVSPGNALYQAMVQWWSQLKAINLDDKAATYTSDIQTNAANFSNMAYEGVTKFGCAAVLCRRQGFTVAVCQYNRVPVLDSPLYEVGTPCSGCTNKCQSLGGLCNPASSSSTP